MHRKDLTQPVPAPLTQVAGPVGPVKKPAPKGKPLVNKTVQATSFGIVHEGYLLKPGSYRGTYG